MNFRNIQSFILIYIYGDPGFFLKKTQIELNAIFNSFNNTSIKSLKNVDNDD